MSLGDHNIPDELRDILLDFTMNYIHNDSGDPVDFGLTYFTRLKDKTSETKYVKVIPQTESMGPCKAQTRRKAVFSETNRPIESHSDSRVSHTKTEEEKGKLKETLKRVFVFSTADDETLDEVVENLQKEVYCPQHIVLKEGEDSHTFYIVEEGMFEAYVTVDKENREVAVYDGEGTFGATALLHNTPCDVTIKAITKGVLWALDRGTFRMIFLNAAIKRREENMKMISSVPFLKSLNDEERLSLADALIHKEYKEGDKIIAQGGRPDGMYFVAQGLCVMKMLSDETLGEVPVGFLDEGKYFGEMALLSHRPREHMVYAKERVRLAFLGVAAFERLVGPCIEIMKRDVHDFEEQMHKMFGDEANMVDIRGTLTILPAH